MKKPMVNMRNVVIRSLEATIAISENNGWKEMRMTIDAAKEILSLLEEQEPIEPVLDEATKRLYRCGACGEYVGFIDSDIGDPDEKDCFCRKCGRAVKWNRLI